MLRELRIENLLLIERAELRLGEGLDASTGETGAGKTVLEHRQRTVAPAQLQRRAGLAGGDRRELRGEYREAHREWARLAAELAELREREGSRERDLDLYRYELSEIEAVAPVPDEREQMA